MIQHLTFMDYALPIALGAVFGLIRYQGYVRAGVSGAQTRALKDAVFGAIGLAVITLVYKFAFSN